MPLPVFVERCEVRVSDARTRLPFKFGAVILTKAPIVVASVWVRDESGREGRGFSSDLAVPKWFEKNPNSSPAADSRALVRSSLDACEVLTSSGSQPRTAFEHWHLMEKDRVGDRDETVSDVLVRGFGVALMERAVIDAVCQMAHLPFHAALMEDTLGFRPGDVIPELSSWKPSFLKARELPASISLRHTIGMLDPLTNADVDEVVNDGLPQTLEDVIQRYGVKYFKIKIGGDPTADEARLVEIARFLGSHHLDEASFTLDANEQYEDLAVLTDLLVRLRERKETAGFMGGFLFVEQPLPRNLTFQMSQRGPLAKLSGQGAVIIDEADHGVHAFRRALELGYMGCSIKNCKGVFRALLNCGVAEAWGKGAFQSAEDLTNTGVIPLQQNLATLSVLGQTHVEMNGHHYFRGLDHLPDEEVAWALKEKPGLFESMDPGATLMVRDGLVDLRSAQGVGFGAVAAVSFHTRKSAIDWLESTS